PRQLVEQLVGMGPGYAQAPGALDGLIGAEELPVSLREVLEQPDAGDAGVASTCLLHFFLHSKGSQRILRHCPIYCSIPYLSRKICRPRRVAHAIHRAPYRSKGGGRPARQSAPESCATRCVASASECT